MTVTRIIAERLTDELYWRLSGRDLESVSDKVILLVSLDGEGWPHAAVLSYFEVVAKDRENIRIATYADSRTTANMRRHDKVTMAIVDRGFVGYIKGSA